MPPPPKPLRKPWNGFPDVVIVAEVAPVKKHVEYQQAKAGNVNDAASAAKRLSNDFVLPAAIEAIQQLPLLAAFLVPVHALEEGGHNRIPGSFAELLAEKLQLEVELAIIQANVVNHTGASGWERMARPPVFGGNVVAGRSYILVDDFVGQGGTLANLRGHIAHGGGLVRGAITLTGQPYSAKLALRPETLETLRAKHGREIENWWIQRFGFDFGCLTESEGRYLLHAENADTIRARLSAAGPQGDD
jgi:hypothetical protein